jgi:hypothetical protein
MYLYCKRYAFDICIIFRPAIFGRSCLSHMAPLDVVYDSCLLHVVDYIFSLGILL